jgi:hypothetical protein
LSISCPPQEPIRACPGVFTPRSFPRETPAKRALSCRSVSERVGGGLVLKTSWATGPVPLQAGTLPERGEPCPHPVHIRVMFPCRPAVLGGRVRTRRSGRGGR